MARRRRGRRSSWPQYVPVAERVAKAERYAQQLARKGKALDPIRIDGRRIVHTVWGQAWCDHIEGMGDLSSRLDRGRTYVRRGAVLHLEVKAGRVEAKVAGTRLYSCQIDIKQLPQNRWEGLLARCGQKVDSVVALLEGRLSAEVMAELCNREEGLFPRSEELEFRCSCPDFAWLCKHLAAVFYGIGARLDGAPELLFTLRGVAAEALVGSAARAGAAVVGEVAGELDAPLDGVDLGALFGIELAAGEATRAKAEVTSSTKPLAEATSPAKTSTETKSPAEVAAAAKTKAKRRTSVEPKAAVRTKTSAKTKAKIGTSAEPKTPAKTHGATARMKHRANDTPKTNGAARSSRARGAGVGEVAVLNAGEITDAQLREAGASATTVRELLERGLLLETRRPGVFLRLKGLTAALEGLKPQSSGRVSTGG